MTCKYLYEEICTNDECPKRAEYCPVPDDADMCRYAELIEEVYKLTLEGCAFAAAIYAELPVTQDQFDVFWKEFMRLAARDGYIMEKEADGNAQNADRITGA